MTQLCRRPGSMERANDLFHNHSLTLITPSTAKKYLCTYVSLGEEFNRGRCDDAAVHGGLGDFALLGDWITYPFDFSCHLVDNSTHKAHANGIKKRRRTRYVSQKGMDPKFLRNQKVRV